MRPLSGRHAVADQDHDIGPGSIASRAFARVVRHEHRTSLTASPGNAVRNHASVVPIAQFLPTPSRANFPGLAIIDPDFGHSSGENPQNIVHAEVFAAAVVQAIMESHVAAHAAGVDLR